MSELPQRLRDLASRGTARGADDVFAAAQAEATSPIPIATTRFPKQSRLVAIAAAVMIVGGVAAAVNFNGDNASSTRDNDKLAVAPTTTSTAAPDGTTTTLPESVRVFLTSTRLVPFDACPSLAAYARSKALDTVGPYGLPGGGGISYGRDMIAPQEGRANSTAGGTAGDSAAGAPAPVASPSLAATDDSGDEFSTTNVQEAGIDEPDTAKTDGKTIFTVTGGKVRATKAGDSPQFLSSIDVQGARELLLVGKRLIVLSDGGYYAYPAGGVASSRPAIAPAPGGSNPSRFAVYDVSDPTAMKFSGSFDVDGSYLSARVVDGVARIVVQSYPRFQWAYPQTGDPAAQAAATEQNRQAIRNAPIDTWLPHFTTTNAAGKASASKPLATCNNSYRPPEFSGFGMLSVVTFDAAHPTDSQATSVMADGGIVYASAKRLYVATNEWQNVNAQGQVVSSPQTLVHAFDISDPTNASYVRSGRVRGTVLNQFSMSERDDVLRVATTDFNGVTGGDESFLSTMKDDGTTLATIGQVGGLGHGERIRGVRFIDANAYIVTFRQTDPLYVVDASDPTKPRLAGELAITGYSSYLHPIGPGLLLGIGQEATPEGRVIGFQLSIFDVRNASSPKLVARKVIDQSGSTAEYDHHAFLYWAKTGLAVVPMYQYDASQGYRQSFNGAIGFRVTEDSITEVGRVQQPDAPQYGDAIDRSLVIGSRLYTTSYRGVLANRLDNLESLAWSPYPDVPTQPTPVPYAID